MKRILLLALVGAAPVGALIAQTNNQAIIDRSQQPTPPPVPGAATPAATDEKGDLDGGTQRIAEARKRPFKLTFGYDLAVNYTSNVFLQSTKVADAVVFAHTLTTSAEFNSFAVGNTLVTPTAGLVYQHYNHGLGTGDENLKSLDFDSYSIPLALRVRYGNNWEFGLSVTPNAVYTIEGHPSYDLTYKAVTTAVSVRKLISLSKNQILSLGGSVGYAKTDSVVPSIVLLSYRADRNDKIDTAIDAGYYYLMDRWVFGSYARLSYSDYLHYEEGNHSKVDRCDLNGSVGLSVSYNINSWASARATTSYEWRTPQGNSFVDYTYETANLGVGVSLSASF
ncbi:MAG: hypothetical protein WC205_18440 [Opitutaceae bacterium]|jgi:hypothetical protein